MRTRRFPDASHVALALLAAACLLVVAGCAREPTDDVEPAAALTVAGAGAGSVDGPAVDPSPPSTEGVFEGALPCDGCDHAQAVDATLHLRPDGGFELIERQADGGETIEHAGVWYASDDGRAILLADDHGHGHRVFEWQGDDALRLLPDAPVDDAEPVVLVRAD
ncbi:copper resistance protein NlpE [Luteimonas yindakuii]|uniref:copper resistance protein NlpE N-terminal domain-containing protein n=1 Tax=Luteimonas yindakuii TaxID=2565782 RepID=UPI0010A561BE|nr:copper resistance protein NlpE N-terminal domain-containing protein [Luteimonas yindakuii]QCO67934.1 copper resistance protein NlpE [Luteimonas yindakuii]